MMAALAKRDAGADHRVGERAPRRDSQAPVVNEGAGAFLGPEHLVAQRLIDEPCDDLAVALERDRDRPMRNAVQEIGGAVERIDDPAMMRIAAARGAALFHEEAIAGPRLRQLGLQGLLGFEIGGRDELARSLDRDLQLLDLAEIADEPACRLQGGPGHDIDECRADRHRATYQSLARSM